MVLAAIFSCYFIEVRNWQIYSGQLVHDVWQLLLVMVDGPSDIGFARQSQLPLKLIVLHEQVQFVRGRH